MAFLARDTNLVVYTARMVMYDPDALDVTRRSGDLTFAPSERLFYSAIDARKAGTFDINAWLAFKREYLEEMRVSQERNQAAWLELLLRDRVVLTCYCETTNCHRVLLANILMSFGAKYEGEL